MYLADMIACRSCDLLHRKVPLEERSEARCTRCGAVLYRRVTDRVEPLLAVTLGALITFLFANLFPIVELETQGITTQTTLIGAVVLLWQDDRWPIALIVLCTTILFPLTEMLALIYLLVPLQLRRRPRLLNGMLRTILAVRPWGMLEVFMLGTLVALVKLSSAARMIPEPALFAFGAMTLLVGLINSFDPRVLWDVADARCGKPAEPARRPTKPSHTKMRPASTAPTRHEAP